MNSQPEPSGSRTPNAAGIEPAQDDGLEFEPESASSQAATLSGGDNEPPAVWYVARPGGPHLGPITLVALKKQLVAGTVSSGDLVWKAGMPGWVRAEIIPDLSVAPPGVPPPLARSGFDKNADLLRHLNGILAGAAFYRVSWPWMGSLHLAGPTFFDAVYRDHERAGIHDSRRLGPAPARRDVRR